MVRAAGGRVKARIAASSENPHRTEAHGTILSTESETSR
jgi:hypothetical protein